jgi:hypothetical protein
VQINSSKNRIVVVKKSRCTVCDSRFRVFESSSTRASTRASAGASVGASAGACASQLVCFAVLFPSANPGS